MALTTSPCGVCGGVRFIPVYPAALSADDPDPAVYFSSSRSRAGYLPIVRCAHCGLMMTNPRDDDATLKRIYAALEDRVYDAEDDNRCLTAREHLTLVMSFRPQPARLLDVGCATGTFACVAHRAGWQVTGLDASAWGVERARQKCPQARFVIGLLEEVDFTPKGFDVITLWDVLEHVRSPRETMARVRDWLAPGGLVFLNLPNADSLIARAMGRRWMLLLREHLWYFSPATMALLLKQCGFGLIRTRPNFVRFSAANVFGRLAQYPGAAGAAGRWLSGIPASKRVSVRFPMGEMNVIARRKDG